MHSRHRVAVALGLAALCGPAAANAATASPRGPSVSAAVAHDTSPPLHDMRPVAPRMGPGAEQRDFGGVPEDTGHGRDGALQADTAASTMPGPLFSFEGPTNEDNRSLFGFRVNPPDPVGDVGLHHYVAMVNLSYSVYTKTGTRLLGPVDTGTLWQGFPVEDCTDSSGDPIVLYDEIADRWLLSQFTTRFETDRFYNCVAVSATGDPLGRYHRYAFSTGANFPDYPKYGVWPDAYYISTREFGPDNSESVGVYAVDRRKMLQGDLSPRMVGFNLASPAYLKGDGLLPADLDGSRLPPPRSPAYFAGSMDDEHRDGGPFDGLNLFQAKVDWNRPERSTFALTHQLRIAAFDTLFPCVPRSRDCIPQPDTHDANRRLDILSYRQRPTWRLAYRNFGAHESLVTTQSVEARRGVAGLRWWEIRNPSDPVLHQDGTWAPDDGVHRWMGSVAMDKAGNLALGYSVSNAADVRPGIRYAGRLASDPLNVLGRGEAVLQEGGGSQLTLNSRWGDYTSMNVDPADGCTFYYMNEYYPQTDLVGWHTRIGAFRFPNCA